MMKKILLLVALLLLATTSGYCLTIKNGHTYGDYKVVLDKNAGIGICLKNGGDCTPEWLAKTCDIVVCRDPNQACDIYCLDNDCSDEIQSAIDYVANKGGGTVCIRRGEYPVHNIHLKSNITILSAQNTVYLLNQNSSYIFVVSTLNGDSVVKNVRIIGGVFDGNNLYTAEPGALIYFETNQSDYYAYFENIEIRNIICRNVKGVNEGGGCIWLRGVRNALIVGNRVENARWGINVEGPHGSNIVILGNYVENVEKDGITVGLIHAAKVIGNTIYNAGSHGIGVDSGHETVIYGNHIFNAVYGIGVFTSIGDAPDYVFISNNYIKDWSDVCKYGIYVMAGKYATIFGNTIENCNEEGILVRGGTWNTKILGNSIINDGGIGIHLYDAHHSIVAQNIIKFINKGLKGIYLENYVNMGIISNNDINNANVGIEIANDCNYNIVRDNSIDLNVDMWYNIANLNNFVDGIIYTSLPACHGVFTGRYITYYDGTSYKRCTCIDGSWKCVQLS